MKFKSVVDEQVFREEWLRSGLSLDEFLVKRGELELGLVDWERSQRQKQNWRKYRWRYLKGIRDFHSSTAGKRFHRNLGRFLATRDTETLLRAYQKEKEKERELRALNLRKVRESLEFLIAVLSAGVHALIEERYYKVSVDEAVDYKLFLEELLRKVKEVLDWLFDEVEGEDWDFWIGVVYPKEWEKMGLSIPEKVEEEGGMLEWLVREVRQGKVVLEEEGVDDEEGVKAGSA
jgi:hypothetical protein